MAKDLDSVTAMGSAMVTVMATGWGSAMATDLDSGMG